MFDLNKLFFQLRLLIFNVLNVFHKQVINFLESNDVDIVSITFDGHRTNLAFCEDLGASFSLSNFKPEIQSLKGSTIVVFLDICHMLKIIRNNFKKRVIFYDSDNMIIDWSLLENLNNIQIDEGLHIGNKITTRHINFEGQIMKVYLAAQVFSNSTADALHYLSVSKDHKDVFKNSIGTICFLKRFNNMFDIFNSKNILGTQYKRVISKKNSQELFEYLEECKDYIMALTYLDNDGMKCSVLTSTFKTGFLGFVMAIENFKKLFNRLVLEEGSLEYLTTFKFCQDHLETFFSCIRSRGGFNNNPSAFQFHSAYRKLLMNKSVRASKNVNCAVDESIEMVETYNDIDEPEIIMEIQLSEEEKKNEEEEEIMPIFEQELSTLSSDIVEYIAGFVQKVVARKIHCNECKKQLSIYDTYSSNSTEP